MKNTETQEQLKEVNKLIKSKKGLIKDYLKLKKATSPILLFMRRNGKATYYQNAKMGRYEFEHSDGTSRYIIIDKNAHEVTAGDDTIKMYICHEDYPFPLPEEPLITTEMFNLIIEKTLHDKKEWETKLTQARSKMIWTIMIGIAILFALYMVYKMVFEEPAQTVQVIDAFNRTAQVIK